jgi:RNA polymerase sigma-70 factor (ECF subfamily)
MGCKLEDTLTLAESGPPQTLEADFAGLAAEHRDAVYRQMLRLCGNREDAEDVLTDALLAAYLRLETLRERAAFGGWLAQIARRLCFRLRSQQRIREALSLDDLAQQGFAPVEGSPGPEEQMLAAELRRAVQTAVDALPAEYGAVYVLRDLEERSGEQTAAELGLSLAAMKSRLHRARQMVRERLDAAFAMF